MSDLQFETEIDVDYEGMDAKATLKWELDLDCRSWGIKSFDAYVPKQTVSFVVTDESGEEDIDKDIDLVIDDYETEYTTRDSTSLLCPNKLEVSGGKITIHF